LDATATELTEFAAQQQAIFDGLTTPTERKRQGHFGTPTVIAEFMAGMFSELASGSGDIRVLDAGAGVGVLSAAVCQAFAKSNSQGKLHVELWENDPKLLPILKATMNECQEALGELERQMTYEVQSGDFILANTQKDLFSVGPEPSFHWAILNPPYFKLRKDSAHAQVMSHVVHGQPNIYALFMALATDFLLPQGELVAITPRSYFNGPYFKRFRKWFFDRMALRKVHVFESRTEAFKSDSVLQENVIIHAQKGGKPAPVALSSSSGRDLTDVSLQTLPYDKIVDQSSNDRIIRVASDSFENDIVDAMDSLPHRFRELGYEVSTGPVVTFRATEFLRNERSSETAPLLWMHNVRPFITQFPPKNGKPGHILQSERSKKLLLPSKNYVLLKRFTSKEERRRLIAGIYRPADSYSEWVGLENHVNYVYRKDVELRVPEVYGLAAFFNTAFVDRYFRAISGNTQVNATEMRVMPVPEVETLCEIGEQVMQMESRNPEEIESVVGKYLGLPKRLLARLIEDCR